MSNINELIYNIFLEVVDTSQSYGVQDTTTGQQVPVLSRRAAAKVKAQDPNALPTYVINSKNVSDDPVHNLNNDIGLNSYKPINQSSDTTPQSSTAPISSLGTAPTVEPVRAEKQSWNPTMNTTGGSAAPNYSASTLADRAQNVMTKSAIQPIGTGATAATDSATTEQPSDSNTQQSDINAMVLKQQNDLQRQINDAALKEKQLGSGVGRIAGGIGAGLGGVGAGALGLLGLLLRNKALANAGLAGLAGGLYYGFNTPNAWRQRRVDIANARMKSAELRQQATDAYGKEAADQMMTTGRNVVSGKFGSNNTVDTGFNPGAAS